MKKLQCELCGSIDILKEDGLFVCQHCGCKYTLEEARNMIIEGPVEVKGTVKVDNSASVQNFLDIGENALLAGNGKQAELYANKALEVDPRNSAAWRLKMMSYEHTATFGDLQIDDVCAAGINVIEYAKDREKAEEETYTYYLNRALTLLNLATLKMEEVDELKNTYKTFALISLLSAATNTAQVDAKVLELYEGVATSAVALIGAVPDEALAKYEGMFRLVKRCAVAYSKETEAVKQRLQVYFSALKESALIVREGITASLHTRAQEGLKAYKANHPEYTKRLQEKIDALEEQKKELELQKENVKGGAELREARLKSKEIQEKLNHLGFFKRKEEKALIEERSMWDNKAGKLIAEVRKEKAIVQEQIDKLDAEIKEVIEELAD